MSKPWNADGTAYEQGRYIIVDFAGDILADIDPNDAQIDLTIASRGVVPERTLKRHPTGDPRTWRLVLLVGTSGRDPIETRLVLRKGDRPLTEIWLAQLHAADLTPG
jgi:glucan biosynthesis protein